MIEQVGKITIGSQIPASVKSPRSEANEFAVLFYKEILKQGFSGEFMGMESGPYADMAREVFIENLAKEFAAKNASMMSDLK